MSLRSAAALFASIMLLASSASAQMSEGEKKAAARAAYAEGIQLQDQGKPAEALARFESAQTFYDAPTHLLHIAECQALTGRLVEASETYETLIRKPLPPGSPDVFVQAQEQAKAELPPLRQRIPTLRVTTKPDARTLQSLIIVSNGKQLPDEIVGIARPVNPGTYDLAASANGWGTTDHVKFELREKEAKNVELTLVQGGPAAVVLPPGTAPSPAPPFIEDKSKSRPKDEASKVGLLLGLHAGVFVPGGSVVKNRKFETVGKAGPGGGIDVIGRFARFVLVGGTVEFVSFGGPDKGTLPAGTKADVSTTSIYVGVNAGIVPNIDKVSFIADIGLGLRTLTYDAKMTTATGDELKEKADFSGLEIGLNAGLSIPAGPIRIVPKAGIAYGQFTSRECELTNAGSSAGCGASGTSLPDVVDTAGHTIFSIGVGGFYHIDLSKKAASSKTAKSSSSLALW